MTEHVPTSAYSRSSATLPQALMGGGVLASQLEACGKRFVAAARSLEARVPAAISREQLDQALAHYAYGLTQPLYAKAEPVAQLNAIVLLMSKALPADRIDQAIHSKPAGDQRLSSTCESLIRLGERDALAIISSHISPGSSERQVNDSPDGPGDAEGASR